MVQRERTMRTPSQQDAVELVHWFVGGKDFVRVERVEFFDAGAMIRTLSKVGLDMYPETGAKREAELEREHLMIVVIYISGPRSWFLWTRQTLQRELAVRFDRARGVADRQKFAPLVPKA